MFLRLYTLWCFFVYTVLCFSLCFVVVFCVFTLWCDSCVCVCFFVDVHNNPGPCVLDPCYIPKHIVHPTTDIPCTMTRIALLSYCCEYLCIHPCNLYGGGVVFGGGVVSRVVEGSHGITPTHLSFESGDEGVQSYQ